MVRDHGRFKGRSPSQSYACGSVTTLFIAVAVLSPFQTRRFTAIVFRDGNRAAVRVEQQLGWIEPETAIWLERTVGPESIDLACLHPGHEHVPIVVRAVQTRIDGDDTRRASVVHPIEKQQFDAAALREKTEKLAPPSASVAPIGKLRPVVGAASGACSAVCC